MAIGGATTLGSFQARLGLDSSGYAKGILNANALNEVFGRSISTFVANPLLGTVQILKNAAGGFVDFTKHALANAEALQRLSDQTGVSARNIQALRLEWERAGKPVEALDQSLVRFTKRLGLFREQGGGAAAQFLKSQGLAPEDIGDSNAELERWLDTLSKVEDQQTRTAIAVQLFGDDAAAMAQVFGHVRNELDLLAQRPGILTERQIETLADANTKLGTMTQNLKNVATVVGSEFLTSFFENFFKGIDPSDFDAIARTIQDEWVPAATEFGHQLQQSVGDARDLLGYLKEILEVLNFIKENRFAPFAAGQPAEFTNRYTAPVPNGAQFDGGGFRLFGSFWGGPNGNVSSGAGPGPALAVKG